LNRDIIIEILPAVVVAILWFGLWRFLLRYLVRLQGKLSVNVREKILPDIDRVNNTFTTLSAAAIVLTISILQLWSTKAFAKEYYLIVSWIGFALAVFIGAVQGIGFYIYKTHYLCMVKAFEDVQKDGKANEAEKENLQEYLATLKFLDRLLFTLITLQPMIFTASIIYLLMFAVKNI
jgi:hypothetical protein